MNYHLLVLFFHMYTYIYIYIYTYTNMTSKNKEEFWLCNPKCLIINNNFYKRNPDLQTSRLNQLNTLARFSFFLIILFFIFDADLTYYSIPITLLIFTIMLYYINRI